MEIKQKLRVLMKIFAIMVLLSLILLSFGQNYLANKMFDDYFYYIDPVDQGIYGFTMSDEAKAEPVFYWQWECSVREGYESLKYMVCDHCMIGGFKCYYHNFKLNELTQDQIIQKRDLWEHRHTTDNIIIYNAIAMIFLLLGFSFWQYRNHREEWDRTPLGGLINKIREADKSDKFRKD